MRRSILATILLSLILVLAACGGNGDNDSVENTDANKSSEQTQDNGSSDADVSNTVEITSTNWEFDQDEYVVQAGEEVTITHTNAEGMHGIAIDDLNVNIQGDGETTFTADKPGEYKIYCNIPCGEGHSDMISTLIVK